MSVAHLVRVIIIDDSPFICKLLTSYLQVAKGFEVVGVAHNGQTGAALVEKLRPDVVTMDVEMPVMNGLESLERIMRTSPTPVLMISGVNRHAAEITLQALKTGAVDFILKCPPTRDVDPNALRDEIVSKVRLASHVKVIRSLSHGDPLGETTLTVLPPFRSSTETPQKPYGAPEPPVVARELPNAPQKPRPVLPQPPATGVPVRPVGGSRRVESSPGRLLPGGVIVIGASTGGPIALRELLATLPVDLPSAVLVVQHIPSEFTKVLAVQLNNHSSIPVLEAKEGVSLRPGVAYVAPGDFHLLVTPDSRIALNHGPTIGGHRPAIDVTMQSVADVYGPLVKGVILTGMGEDGTNGAKTIIARGGVVFAQDGESSVVDGMPKSAREHSMVSFVGPPAQIGLMLAGHPNREAVGQ
jgi:two-component system chemotaxis response regulator CheB